MPDYAQTITIKVLRSTEDEVKDYQVVWQVYDVLRTAGIPIITAYHDKNENPPQVTGLKAKERSD